MAVSISGDGAVTGVASVETPTTLSGLTIPTLGFGKVLQVVQGTYSVAHSTTSSTYVDSGITATITPSATSSKVFAIATVPVEVNGSINDISHFMNLVRGSTQLVETRHGVYGAGTSAMQLNTSLVLFNFDSPATTSATTYKVQHKKNNGTSITCVSNLPAALVLVEVGP